jgi:hypothetical protein
VANPYPLVAEPKSERKTMARPVAGMHTPVSHL